MQYGELESRDFVSSETAALVDNAVESELNVSAASQSAEARGQLQHQSNGQSAAPPIQMAAESPAVQQAMEIRSSMDSYEREADSVSEGVVNAISGSRSETPQSKSLPRLKVGGTSVQRLSPTMSTASGGSVSADIEAARGGGGGIPDVDRKAMEQSFGADFSGVKVHTDSKSDSLNKSLGSRAFATGKDVFFKRGEYAPGTSSGQKLLAHELTHVVQQNGGPGLQLDIDPTADKALARTVDESHSRAYMDLWQQLNADELDYMPQEVQAEICAFPGAPRRFQPRLDFIRARLLAVYKHRIGIFGANVIGRRQATSAVKKLKDNFVSWGLTKTARLTPELVQRLTAEGVVVTAMATRPGPLVELAATKIPGNAMPGLGNAHAYIRYTTDDGFVFKISAHSDEDGKLKAEIIPYGENVHEYDNRGNLGRVIASGNSAQGKLADFYAAVMNLNAKNVNYKVPISTCNTAARWFLKKAGYGLCRAPNLVTAGGGWYAKIGAWGR